MSLFFVHYYCVNNENCVITDSTFVPGGGTSYVFLPDRHTFTLTMVLIIMLFVFVQGWTL